MTKDRNADDLPGTNDADDNSSADEAVKAQLRKIQDSFLSHQDGLKVPEPAYSRYLKESADQGQVAHTDDFESGDLDGRWSSPPLPVDPAAAQKRERSRRFRFWIFIVLIVLIYVVFRTVDLMR